MGFGRWLMKKGSIDGAARLMIRAYRLQKESNPNASDREIFRTITKWRYGITGKNLHYTTVGTAARSKSLREYLKYIVVIERYRDLPVYSYDPTTGKPTLRGIVEEIVDEICDEENVD